MSDLGFWKDLPKPFFALAPMADVTDAAFRRIIAGKGNSDVFYTEFVSADGLCHRKGRENLLQDLIYSENERPIVAQLFSGLPEKMREACAFVATLGFNGIDINMGCPDKNVEKQSAGACLLKSPERMVEIIRSANEGVKESGRRIPISIKTRLGYNNDNLEEWLPIILKENLSAVVIHLRTRKEMSKVPAKWNRLKDAVKVRDDIGSKTLIIGNGDVIDLKDAFKKSGETFADGVMLGRAIFGNPWLFKDLPMFREKKSRGENLEDIVDNIGITSKEKLSTLAEHIGLFDDIFRGKKNFAIMKKHFKSYTSGLPDSHTLREKLMSAETASEAVSILKLQYSDTIEI